MCNKVIRFLGTMTLIGVLFFGAPVTLFASTSDSEVGLDAYSKEVTDTKYYSPNEIVKPSKSYDDGTWSGTLYLVEQQDVGGVVIAIYRGTVYCTENCPI